MTLHPRTPADAHAESKSAAAFDRRLDYFNIGRTPPEQVGADDAEEGIRFMRGLGYGFLFATMFWAPIVAAIVGAIR